MTAYYNEIDPCAAQWLRNLIAAGHIAPGDVDERSIVDVRPADLDGFTQCHFFAGIGGWSYALRLAGWPDNRPVWTGSCPCQPFSSAGKGKAADDERHLWPAWFPLIAKCGPPIVFGEQVEAAIGWGWIDAVFSDLEGEGYACGTAILPACGVGAPHIRQRLWFVADAESFTERKSTEEDHAIANGGESRALSCGDGKPLADAHSRTPVGPAIAWPKRDPWSAEPAVGRVAYGVSHKLVEPALRGFGNAIVPQVAAEFIAAYWECATAASENRFTGTSGRSCARQS